MADGASTARAEPGDSGGLSRSDSLPLAIAWVGEGLQRPEWVLATASGRLFAADRRGGVMVIEPDGRQQVLGTSSLVPNGIALQRDGSFLIANLSEQGGVWRLSPEGELSAWLTQVGELTLPRVNFVTVDSLERVWICVSATECGDLYPLDDATGYIIVRDAQGTRVVAQGLRYTNECRLSADGQFLYVNETFGRRLSRFRVAADAQLSHRVTLAEFDAGDFPDGMALDAEGGGWVIWVGSNRVCRVSADGQRQTVIDDSDPACVARLEAAFVARELTRPMLSAASGRRFQNITSLAFGGADMRTAYMGCLAGESLASFRSPGAGQKPAHWHWA